jgi:hypothetical protein
MLRNTSFVRVVFVVVMLLAAGCQPVRPLTPQAPAVEAPAAETPVGEAPAAEEIAAVGGAYTGKLSIAGMELDITVTLQEQDGSYSGTIDIPQQGATGIPLQNVTVDGSAVHFEMLPAPQTAVFDGQMAAGGSISGTMVQSGYEGTFSLAPQDAPGEAETETKTGRGGRRGDERRRRTHL